ncbi:MAG: hypothetical protein RL660_953 [Bacteroidota bacterium]|jgi:tetratricopeptide (TPR) repeat protein
MIKYIAIFFLGVLVASCSSQKTVQGSSAKGGGAQVSTAFSDMFYQATKLRLQNDAAAALEKYQLCLNQMPNHGASNYYAASMCLQLGKMEEAISYSKTALKAEPNNLDFKELLAKAYSQAGNAEQAASTYSELAKARPALAEEYLGGAAFQLMRQGKLQEAYNTLEQLEQYSSGNKDITYKKINLLRRMNKSKEAIVLVDKMLPEANKNQTISLKILKLNLLEDLNNKTAADALFADLLNSAPDDGDVVEMQVERAIASGDTVGYLNALNKLVAHKEIEPERKADLLMPLISMADGNLERKNQVLALGKKLIDASPNDYKAIQIYANILASAGKEKEAALAFGRLVQQDPKDYDNWRRLLSMYGELSDYDSVLSVAKRGLNYFPNQAYIHFMQGYAYQQKQQYDNALKSLRKADDYSAGNREVQMPVLLALADVYNSQAKYTESDKTFDRALQLDSRNATVLNNYAYFLSLRGEQLDKAYAMSKRSLEIEANEKSYLDTYAWVLYKQGKYSEALEQQQKAIAAEGENDATMYEHLGDIYAKLNQVEQAVKSWQQAKAKLNGAANPSLDKKIQTRQLP